jgi:[histone H3]-lysine36 N-dimethyltransferase SETMAR
MNKSEIRVIFLYELKLGHNAAEATRNINHAFGEDTANERTTQRWFAKFRSGDMSLENEPRGRPEAAIDDEQLNTLIESDTRQTVRELADKLSVHYSTVCRHITSIGKVKKLDKWVPHELKEKHKTRRLHVCSSLLTRNKRDPFLRRIVKCDEKWILYDNRRRSAQWQIRHFICNNLIFDPNNMSCKYLNIILKCTNFYDFS